MITDKDREELKELTNQIRKSNQTMQWFDYGWDDCAEIITRYVEKKNAESAEQARKEERIKTIEEVKSRFNHAMPCYAFSSALDKMIESTILCDSVIK